MMSKTKTNSHLKLNSTWILDIVSSLSDTTYRHTHTHVVLCWQLTQCSACHEWLSRAAAPKEETDETLCVFFMLFSCVCSSLTVCFFLSCSLSCSRFYTNTVNSHLEILCTHIILFNLTQISRFYIFKLKTLNEQLLLELTNKFCLVKW